MEEIKTLEFVNISKTFPGVKALSDVSFGIRKGEIHALLGENGAGKSTLLNILQGIYQEYKGEIKYNGKVINIKGPSKATKIGINMVHQELNLVPELTVGQNIFLGFEPLNKFTKLINWNKLYFDANELLKKLSCNFDSREYVKNLSSAQMQMIEITKALMHNSNVIAFDEPTASLTNNEIKSLFDIILKLKNAGTSIIYISHRLDEIFEIADRATILRDGKFIGTYDMGKMDKSTLIKLMVGRDLYGQEMHDKNYSLEENSLEVKNITCENSFRNISFKLKKGEILGISGLVGAGRTEVARAIFGIDKIKSGEIFIDNKKVTINGPEDAIKYGIALIPEERKSQGFVGSMTNVSNVCLSSLNKFSISGFKNRKSMINNTLNFIDKLHISANSVDTETKNLSGGNQQKIVLSKWLTSKANIIIFDEPTRGIDIGAKSDIYKLMNDLVKEGHSIIMISSELPEIIGMSDRVIVMHEGKIKVELNKSDITEESILHYAMGGN